ILTHTLPTIPSGPSQRLHQGNQTFPQKGRPVGNKTIVTKLVLKAQLLQDKDYCWR
ncbi:hypothetical protein GIB67_021367, partial [Kingdonia uniflora]